MRERTISTKNHIAFKEKMTCAACRESPANAVEPTETDAIDRPPPRIFHTGAHCTALLSPPFPFPLIILITQVECTGMSRPGPRPRHWLMTASHSWIAIAFAACRPLQQQTRKYNGLLGNNIQYKYNTVVAPNDCCAEEEPGPARGTNDLNGRRV